MTIPLSPEALSALLRRHRLPARVVEVRPLKPDRAAGADSKVAGYGKPIVIVAEDEHRHRTSFVLHTLGANEFGHDRHADRVDEAVLAYDTYKLIPRHVAPLDVGVASGNTFKSIGEGGEPYLLTTWADGEPYAEDLRRVVERGLSPLDRARAGALAAYLAGLHRERLHDPAVYRRSIRDLLGHGEGIFGIVDSYPSDTPGAPPERLRAIEHQCLDWRWKLRAREGRLARSHGDFHPFNILFGQGIELSLVDASRGCAGDPADDVAALAINYVFFGADRPEAWNSLGQLWHGFWDAYLGETKDGELLEVVAPFLAWRGLVVADPRFYPALTAAGRGRMLGLIERALAAPRLELSWADDCFR